MWVDVDVDTDDEAAMAKLIDDGVVAPVQAVEMILQDVSPRIDTDLTDLARHIVNVLQY